MMNGYERIMAAIEGRPADRVPVMLHNFMMAAEEAGYSMAQYREDPVKIADAHSRAIEKYDYDGIFIDVDTATLAGAIGVPVDYPENEPARCHGAAIKDLSEVMTLEVPDIANDKYIGIWLQATQLLRKRFGDEICVRGNCDQAPFSLASMMRTPAIWLMDLLDEDNRDNVMALLEYCTMAGCRFVELMAEAGAHMISNGDSPAGPDMISPQMYRQFALPGEKKVIDTAHSFNLPYVLHICGNTTAILEDIAGCGADGLEIDYKTDTRKANDLLKDQVCFIGNIDPSGVLALGTPDDVRQTTLELLNIFADNPRFILNAGCALPSMTPPENLRTMIETARSFRQDGEVCL